METASAYARGRITRSRRMARHKAGSRKQGHLIYGGPSLPSSIDLANLAFNGITILGEFTEDVCASVSKAGGISMETASTTCLSERWGQRVGQHPQAGCRQEL